MANTTVTKSLKCMSNRGDMGGHYEGIPSLEPNSHFVENEFPGERVSETEKCIFRGAHILNFTRSWGFGIFTVYWVSKSKCIISSNLRAEGS